MIGLRTALCVGVVFLLVGCGSLPRGAPLESEFLRGQNDGNASFEVQQVTRSNIAVLSAWPRTGPSRPGWIGRSYDGPDQIIRASDLVSLTIWDSSEASLLTAPGQPAVTMDNLRVSGKGTVFVPYVGDVEIAKRSPVEARQILQDALAGIAPSAQVQLRLSGGRGNTVDLVGGVASPGSYPLVDQNTSLLSLLAIGGGILPNLANPQVRLQRDNRLYVTALSALYEDSKLDTLMRPGDKVVVESDSRTFLSLGATGTEAVHPFTQDSITAMEAVAEIGGVTDSRANPRGLLILRNYPAKFVGKGPSREQVVFALDLTSADGLFAAGQFEVMDGDLIFATESPVTAIKTVFGLVGSAVGLANAIEN